MGAATACGLPALGARAGAIFTAKEAGDPIVGETDQPILGLMDVAVVRSAFGRQKDSYETDLDVEGFGAIKAVFIRAPLSRELGARPGPYMEHPKTDRAVPRKRAACRPRR
ncbi:MAG: hypothetical protein ACP5KY_08020, partial [Thermoproteus sp.]